MKRRIVLGALGAVAVMGLSSCGVGRSPSGPIDGRWRVDSVTQGTHSAVDTGALSQQVTIHGGTVDGDDGHNVHHARFSYDHTRVSVTGESSTAVGSTSSDTTHRAVAEAFSVLFHDGSFSYDRSGRGVTLRQGDTTVTLVPAQHSS